MADHGRETWVVPMQEGEKWFGKDSGIVRVELRGRNAQLLGRGVRGSELAVSEG